MAFSKTQVSPLQIYSTRNFTGLTESNHLSNAYLTRPEKVGSLMAYAYGYQEDNVLTLLTGGIGNTISVSNREYEWDLHSQSERTIEIVTDSPQAASGVAGIGQTPIQVYFGERWFEERDNIVADDQTTFHIVDIYQEGAYFVYTIIPNDPDPTSFVDTTVINTGARFSKDYATVSEYSDRGTGVSYATPYKLQNQLTTLRKTYNVTRNAAKSVMVLELTNPATNQSTKFWTKLSEWTAMAEWYRELDRSYIYSIYNKNQRGEVSLKGVNQRPVYHGAGLRQQVAPANIRFYTKLTYNILDQFLLDLSYNADKWGGNHNFVALTGKMGMREFNDAVTEHARGNNITITQSGTFISGKGDSLTFTGYFKTVEFMNGVTLTVKEFPPYDDMIRNRALHPKTKKPLESYRFTILNFGKNKEGSANIKKVALSDSEMAYWHVAGSTDPFGGVAKSISTMRASGTDGYEVHFLSECGLMLEDPTSCGELIMAMN